MVDYVEVGRTAHELHARMGWHAHVHAGRLAAEALAAGNQDDYEFWKAVEGNLRPQPEADS